MDLDVPVAIGDRVMVGQVPHRVIDERNGQFYMERITDRPSIVDQMRPLQEEYTRQWHNIESRYIAGIDPVDRGTPGSGGGSFTLTTGARGHAELDRAIQERITQERARQPAAYDMAGTVARYGHLLTAADQQRLGYVAPPPAPPAEMAAALAFAYGDSDRSTSILDMMTRPTLTGENAYKWGLQSKGTQPVANFLAPPTMTAEDAEKWRQESPWG